MTLPLDALVRSLDDAGELRPVGSVQALIGLSIRALMPGARVGDFVQVLRREGPPLACAVVGFDQAEVRLMPLGDPRGVGPGDALELHPEAGARVVGDALLGRVLDGLGQPLDDGPPLEGARVTASGRPPAALERPRITAPLPTGVRAVDGLLTLGRGQRVGLFAGSGVGKSTLLGQIARGTSADVVVVCLVGERGRELVEFLEDSLGPEGRARSVVVCATSDAPAMVRLESARTATTIAEHFRDQGKDVLLLMDSVTRFARAAREVALAAGEAPARRGYPPSVFAALPALLERAGTAKRGSITGIYTVLVEGGDMEEPIADEVRGILDGHILLDRALAARGRYPAIDVLGSLSRLFTALAPPAQREAATRLRQALSLYESKRDLILLGAYQAGSDAALDAAVAAQPAIEAFLGQAADEHAPLEATRAALASLP